MSEKHTTSSLYVLAALGGVRFIIDQMSVHPVRGEQLINKKLLLMEIDKFAQKYSADYESSASSLNAEAEKKFDL